MHKGQKTSQNDETEEFSSKEIPGKKTKAKELAKTDINNIMINNLE